MEEYIIRARTASFIILSYYHKIIEYSMLGLEDSIEFLNEVEELREYITYENEEYERITKEEIDSYFEAIKDIDIHNSLDAREYLKLKETRRIKEGAHIVGDTPLSSIISSKMLIDALKYTSNKIEDMLYDGELPEEDIKKLKMYLNRYKYNYLNANKYIENIALKANFNIAKIETYSFYEIESIFNIKFVKEAQKVFYEYLIGVIADITNQKENDRYFNTFMSLIYYGKFKSIFPYLNKENLEKLKTYLNNNYQHEKHSAITKIKKLIDTRTDNIK